MMAPRDRTRAMTEAYAARDSRIRIIAQPNRAVATLAIGRLQRRAASSLRRRRRRLCGSNKVEQQVRRSMRPVRTPVWSTAG